MDDKKGVKKEQNTKRCVKCGSTLCYIRFRTGQKVCRSCGHIEDDFVEVMD